MSISTISRQSVLLIQLSLKRCQFLARRYTETTCPSQFSLLSSRACLWTPEKELGILAQHFPLFRTISIGCNQSTTFEFTVPWNHQYILFAWPFTVKTSMPLHIYFLFCISFSSLAFSLSYIFSVVCCLRLQVPFCSTNHTLSLLQLDFIMLLFPVCLLSLFSTFSFLMLSLCSFNTAQKATF